MTFAIDMLYSDLAAVNSMIDHNFRMICHFMND